MRKSLIATYEDDTLVALFKEGNTEAFGILVERHAPLIKRTLYPLLRNPELIEDILQDTYLKAIKGIHRGLYTGGTFPAWIIRIAHNEAVNFLRKKSLLLSKTTQAIDFEDGYGVVANIPDVELGPEERLIKNEIGYDVNELLNDLPSKQKEVIVLKIFQDFKFREISEFTGDCIETCKGRFYNGLKSIHAKIELLSGEKQKGSVPQYTDL